VQALGQEGGTRTFEKIPGQHETHPGKAWNANQEPELPN